MLRNVVAGAAVVAWATCLMSLVGYLLGQGPLAGTFLPAGASGFAVPVALAAALTATGLLLHNFRRKFIFMDYVHADR
jgi:hypothetical protein